MIQAPLETPPIVILDTNVVFDWLLFENPDCTALARAIVSGGITWIATQEMMDEADHVLARGTLDAWASRHALLRGVRTDWVRTVPAAVRLPAGPRCTDADDQKFIDLAMSLPGSCLVTRDKALLRLRRKAGLAGVIVLQPAEWSAKAPGAPGHDAFDSTKAFSPTISQTISAGRTST